MVYLEFKKLVAIIVRVLLVPAKHPVYLPRSQNVCLTQSREQYYSSDGAKL